MAFPSTFLSIYTEVIDRVRLDPDDTDKVKDWVNQVYAEVCIETEAIQDYSTMNLTASQAVYTLDTSISRIKQMYVTPSGQGPSRPLVPTSIEQILEWSASNGAAQAANGSVTHYAVFGITDIQFYPTPNAADVVTVYFVKLPTALSGDSDVPALGEPYVSNCLVEGACFEAALFLKDPDAQLYKLRYDDAVKKFRGHLRRREGSMTRQFRITRGDAVTPHDRSTDVRGWR